MSTRYGSNYDLTLPVSDENAAIALAANTEDNFTVAGTNNEKFVAVFEYPSDSEVFVAVNYTAAQPSAGTIDYPSTSMFKPKRLFVKAGDIISLIGSGS